ncbi:MAG: DNA-3-methyladenine glycosylase 2 family protein [Anderseniella sp.]|jgi:DNA-3-methyladenine glycosylase II|nr:DNA-3-methyladenine glycosylase 2 family protein [Anderseniella sp.]
MQANGFAINTLDELEQAAVSLIRLDGRFAVLHERNGLPRLRTRQGGLEGLAWIVTGQLISARAAEAIWQRVSAALAPFEARQIAGLDIDEVAGLGLTRAKAQTIIDAAGAVRDGAFSFAALEAMDDAQAARALTNLRGIGRWSADIYLMTCLGRPDAWPAGDLAVRAGVQAFLGMPSLPAIAAMDGLASGWRPWRAVAARFLWDHYVETRLKGRVEAG